MDIPINRTAFELTFQQRFDPARLKLLDAFFELELAVGVWAKELGHRENSTSFGQRVQALADDTGLSDRAKPGQLKYIRSLPTHCSEVLRLRNAVVHSRATEGSIMGQPAALLQTLPLALAGEGAVLPIRIEEVNDAATRAHEIASHLRNFLQQNKRDF